MSYLLNRLIRRISVRDPGHQVPDVFSVDVFFPATRDLLTCWGQELVDWVAEHVL